MQQAERIYGMEAVVRVERALRDVLSPHKINLATLGNVFPHLHWHVIARFGWDSHFPAPVWAALKKLDAEAAEQLKARLQRVLAQIPQVSAHLLQTLAAAGY